MIDYTNPIFDRLQDCADPLSKEQIDGLQEDLGVILPDEHREFLLRFNGGSWRHRVWYPLDHEELGWNELHLDLNLGVVPSDRFLADDIRETIVAYEGRLLASFVPIARSGISIIGIECDAREYGRVKAWNNTVDEHENYLIHPVAESFEAFLAGLLPVDDSEFYRETLPAFQAVERGDRLAVRQYLEDGGKVDLRNAAGYTLLMCAARKSWPKIGGLLLEAGADPNAQDPQGHTPLYHSLFGDSLDSAQLLVAAGADVHYRDPLGLNLAEIAHVNHSYRMKSYFEKCLPEENH